MRTFKSLLTAAAMVGGMIAMPIAATAPAHAAGGSCVIILQNGWVRYEYPGRTSADGGSCVPDPQIPGGGGLNPGVPCDTWGADYGPWLLYVICH
ncbi:hypothetical protein ABZ990_15860 [Streptomyces sp. NPDC046203]|uniref:hypothetical protein n=1 Tax=Streptomyces sp. NPDC046203 TaxID=3154602 RepID=UPI0033F5D2C0